MFTLDDIRNIAVQIERNGEESYRNAAVMVKDQEVARMLKWMADEEKDHAEWFEKIRIDSPLTDQQQEIEAMGRSLLQKMVKGNTFLLTQDELEQAQTVIEVLDRSRVLEQDTILFYEFLLGFLEDRETMDQLQKIIEEEHNHLRRLELVVIGEKGKSTAALPC